MEFLAVDNHDNITFGRDRQFDRVLATLMANYQRLVTDHAYMIVRSCGDIDAVFSGGLDWRLDWRFEILPADRFGNRHADSFKLGIEGVAIAGMVAKTCLNQDRRAGRIVQERQIIAIHRALITTQREPSGIDNRLRNLLRDCLLGHVQNLGAVRGMVVRIEMNRDVEITRLTVVPVHDAVQVFALIIRYVVVKLWTTELGSNTIDNAAGLIDLIEFGRDGASPRPADMKSMPG